MTQTRSILIILATLFLISLRPGQPNEYGKWQMFYKINHDDFVQVGEPKKIEIVWKPYSLQPGQRQMYKKYVFYSPDSAYFLDLDSYSRILEKGADGSLTWGAGDPESRVELVNTQGFDATTLLYFGTNGFPETAFWRGQSWFVVCGFTKNEADEFVPTTWWYDLTKKTYTENRNSKTFKTLDKTYSTDVRFAGVPERK